MNFTMKEIVKFVGDNDIKFIKLSFADLRGDLKCITILPTELPRAFDKGISIDGSAVEGFAEVSESDLFLRPDPSTLVVIPMSTAVGREIRMIADIVKPDGTPFECDTRNVLKRVIERAFEQGYVVKIGAESEFYLFETENGRPTKTPIDCAGYLDMSPLDAGEELRHEVCKCLEEMNMFPETSHHEQGAGQNEIDFRYSDALSAADNFLSFKWVVKSLAAKRGWHASFMPKPLPGEAGNGLHINLSIEKNGENIFDVGEGCSTGEAKHFVAGILAHASEITAVLNSVENSYERLGYYEAPKVISWSRNNRSAYIRIPSSSADGNRMELRVADNAVNPYLAIAAVISAGLDGIERKMPIPAECRENLYRRDVCEKYDKIPDGLQVALKLAKSSTLLKHTFGNKIFDKYFRLLEAESKSRSSDALFKRL